MVVYLDELTIVFVSAKLIITKHVETRLRALSLTKAKRLQNSWLPTFIITNWHPAITISGNFPRIVWHKRETIRKLAFAWKKPRNWEWSKELSKYLYGFGSYLPMRRWLWRDGLSCEGESWLGGKRGCYNRWAGSASWCLVPEILWWNIWYT